MSSPSKRRDQDIMRLMMSGLDVDMGDNAEFFVRFQGPADSAYAGGIWKVRIVLPEQYPIKSPSVGFCTRIFHPNIDEPSGSVCLDVINQAWSPMYDLVNVLTVFLPQLLLYPNPADPLNGEAAALLMRDKPAYEERVRQYVQRYASTDIRIRGGGGADADDEAADAAAEAGALSDMDDDVAGELEL